MAYRTGRCTNDLYCASASAKQNVQVPVESQFVCPQCGKALSEPPLERRSFMRPALLACGGLVVAGGALFAAGTMIGKNSPATVPQETLPADRSVASVPAPVTPPVSASGNAEPGPSVPATGNLLPAAIVQAANPPAPIAAPPSPQISKSAPATVFEAAHPPPQQASAAPPNPVQLAMVQTPPPPAQAAMQAEELATRQARAVELARRAALAQAASDKQKQAQDLRRKAQLAKAEAQAEDRAKQEAEAARVAQAELAAAAQARATQQAAAAQAAIAQAAAARPPAPVKAAVAAPPAPRGPTRGFSTTPVSGGAPAYPSAYESDGRAGRVTVSCLITASGSPSGCRVVASQGGVGFSNAALSWLHSGEVRYAPILRDGQPRTEEHSWSISFQP